MSQSKRLNQLNDLKTFGTDFQNSLDNVFNKLNWDQKSFQEDESMVWCPIDSNHLVSNRSFDKHLKRCQIKAKGLTNEEMDQIESLPESTAFYYESCPHIKPLVIDKQMQQKIFGEPIDVGFGSDRWPDIELSTEQRLALYNHVIQTTSSDKTVSQLREQSSSIDLFEEYNKKAVPKSVEPETDNKMQIRSKIRDSKRRRPSYRSKKGVHIKGMSYTEIIGQVIENHCKTLEENLKSNQTKSFSQTQGKCETHSKGSHKNRTEYKTERKHKQFSSQSQERSKKHRHHKH